MSATNMKADFQEILLWGVVWLALTIHTSSAASPPDLDSNIFNNVRSVTFHTHSPSSAFVMTSLMTYLASQHQFVLEVCNTTQCLQDTTTHTDGPRVVLLTSPLENSHGCTAYSDLHVAVVQEPTQRLADLYYSRQHDLPLSFDGCIAMQAEECQDLTNDQLINLHNELTDSHTGSMPDSFTLLADDPPVLVGVVELEADLIKLLEGLLPHFFKGALNFYQTYNKNSAPSGEEHRYYDTHRPLLESTQRHLASTLSSQHVIYQHYKAEFQRLIQTIQSYK